MPHVPESAHESRYWHGLWNAELAAIDFVRCLFQPELCWAVRGGTSVRQANDEAPRVSPRLKGVSRSARPISAGMWESSSRKRWAIAAAVSAGSGAKNAG